MLKVPEYIIKHNLELPDCVLFDLDNTIAYHVARTWNEWDKIMTDWCDPRYIKLVEIFKKAGVEIIFFTGRKYSNAYDLTVSWLEKYFGPMKNESNHDNWKLIVANVETLHGADSKKYAYEQNILGKYNVICSFDDSQSCVDMWRAQGILTAQSNNGMK